MTPRWMKFLPLLAVSLLALALPACDADAPAAADTLLGPSVDVVYNQGNSPRYRRVKAAAGEGMVSATIGATGGRIVLGDHELIVPRGAVDAPTEFRMALDPEDHIQVHLLAIRTLPDGSEVNVGAQGFHVPVTLRLGYRAVTEPVNPARMVIVWVQPDGSLVPRPTVVRPNRQRVEASLPHFSRYAVAIG